MKIKLLLGMFVMAVVMGCNSFAEENKDAKTTDPVVLIKTSLGDIKVQLFPEKAPITVKNFLQYVDKKGYNGTIFHRVMDNFMIQGGGFTEDFKKKSTFAPIKNEANNGLSNKCGTIAMARTPAIHSATNQFFINVKDNAFLDHRNDSFGGYGYCVFGKVIEGMNVVEKIKKVETGDRGGHENVPKTNVVIKEIVRVK